MQALALSVVQREANAAEKEVARGSTFSGDLFTSVARELGTSKKQLQREYDAVIKRYKGTKQWMKAPNGKPTNLSERDWVLVRTPRFKAWFGNWEMAGNKAFLEGEPVVSLSGNEFRGGNGNLVSRVAAWFGGKHDGVASHPVLGEVELTRRGVKDSLGHGIGRDKAVAFAAVPDIIRFGRILVSSQDWKGRKYDGYVIAAPITIKGEEYVGEVVVIRTANSQRFYLHEVALKEKLRQPFKTSALPEDRQRTGGDAGVLSIKRILTDVFSVNEKNVSKIVDENGEPMVVYHGSPTFGMAGDESWTFKVNMASGNNTWSPLAGIGNFFAMNRGESVGYARGEDEAVRGFFTSIKNPLVIESWKMPQFGSREEAFVWAKRQKDLSGYDGLIVADEAHVVAFDSNQAKLAGGMNSGEFNAETGDVRFSVAASKPLENIIGGDRLKKVIDGKAHGIPSTYRVGELVDGVNSEKARLRL